MTSISGGERDHIHVLEDSDILKQPDHAVYSSCSDSFVLGVDLVIDFLAGCAIAA